VAVPVVITEFMGDNNIVFISAVDNGNGTQTWTYKVIITSPRSHWNIAWCGGPNSIVGASHDYVYGKALGGLVNTGLCGLRFEMDIKQKGSIVLYWFTLDGVYEMGTVDVEMVNDVLGVVGGDRVLYTITGPVLTHDPTLRSGEKEQI